MKGMSLAVVNKWFANKGLEKRKLKFLNDSFSNLITKQTRKHIYLEMKRETTEIFIKLREQFERVFTLAFTNL